MKKKKVVLMGLGVVAVALVGLVVVNSMKLPTMPNAKVVVGDVESVVSFTGTVNPEKTKAYFGPNQVKTKKVNFVAGDYVKAGDVIAEFDKQALDDQVTQAFLQYRNAQIAYEEIEYNDEVTSEDYDEAVRDIRYYKNRLDDYETNPPTDPTLAAQIQVWEQRLSAARATRDAYDKSFATDFMFERAKNAITAAEISYRQMKTEADEGKLGIVAEKDGVISSINLVEGGYSSSAQPAVMINHTGTTKATFSMGKYDVEKISIGQEVDVTFGVHKLTGKVSRIAGEATTDAKGGATLSAEVEIEDPNNVLKIGMEVDLDISTGSAEQTMIIPVESVKTDRDGDYVYLLKADDKKEGAYKPTKTYIEVGISSDSYIQVTQGLNIGDILITIAPKHIDSIPLVTLGTDGEAGSASSAGAA